MCQSSRAVSLVYVVSAFLLIKIDRRAMSGPYVVFLATAVNIAIVLFAQKFVNALVAREEESI